jgi:hypothetical protein
MFENLDDLRTIQMPPGYPKVDLDQTWETLREGAPKNAPLPPTLNTLTNGLNAIITKARTTTLIS